MGRPFIPRLDPRTPPLGWTLRLDPRTGPWAWHWNGPPGWTPRLGFLFHFKHLKIIFNHNGVYSGNKISTLPRSAEAQAYPRLKRLKLCQHSFWTIPGPYAMKNQPKSPSLLPYPSRVTSFMGVNPSLCYRQTNLGRCEVLKTGGPRHLWNMKSSKSRGELNVSIFLSKKRGTGAYNQFRRAWTLSEPSPSYC